MQGFVVFIFGGIADTEYGLFLPLMWLGEIQLTRAKDGFILLFISLDLWRFIILQFLERNLNGNNAICISICDWTDL